MCTRYSTCTVVQYFIIDGMVSMVFLVDDLAASRTLQQVDSNLAEIKTRSKPSYNARDASGVAGRGDTHRTPAPHTRTTISISCICSATVKKTVFLTVKPRTCHRG